MSSRSSRSDRSSGGGADASYVMISHLASGGMAELYLARRRDADPDGPCVVLKRILPEHARNPHFVSMFLDEARLASRLSHPNIAQVIDVGRTGATYFYTMEYVHGANARDAMQRATRDGLAVPVSTALSIVMGAAAGLHAAHSLCDRHGRSLEIVHRDVSPSNLMIGHGGELKVVDFGVAKAADRMTETRSGTIKGKISYLSPEQCRMRPVDRRSDVFSLGIVAWELLAQRRLFRRDSDYDAMHAIITDPIVAPSKARPALGTAYDAAVLAALERDPERRLATAADFAEALGAAAAREGVPTGGDELAAFMRALYGEPLLPWLEPPREAGTAEISLSAIDVSVITADRSLRTDPSAPPGVVGVVDEVVTQPNRRLGPVTRKLAALTASRSGPQPQARAAGATGSGPQPQARAAGAMTGSGPQPLPPIPTGPAAFAAGSHDAASILDHALDPDAILGGVVDDEVVLGEAMYGEVLLDGELELAADDGHGEVPSLAAFTPPSSGATTAPTDRNRFDVPSGLGIPRAIGNDAIVKQVIAPAEVTTPPEGTLSNHGAWPVGTVAAAPARQRGRAILIAGAAAAAAAAVLALIVSSGAGQPGAPARAATEPAAPEVTSLPPLPAPPPVTPPAVAPAPVTPPAVAAAPVATPSTATPATTAIKRTPPVAVDAETAARDEVLARVQAARRSRAWGRAYALCKEGLASRPRDGKLNIECATAACELGNGAAARVFLAHVPAGRAATIEAICVRRGAFASTTECDDDPTACR